jgi:hypothetical protein
VQGNGTFGIAILDQQTVNGLAPGTFDPPSPEQSTSGNTFRQNLLVDNGNNPDTEGPNGIPQGVESSILYLIAEAAPNCFEANLVVDGAAPIGLDASICPPVAP